MRDDRVIRCMYWRDNVLSFSDALAKEKSERVVVMLGLGNDSVIGFFVGCLEGSDLLMFVKRVLNNQRR